MAKQAKRQDQAKKQAPEKEALKQNMHPIASWDDWFRECGAIRPVVEDYQQYVYSWEKTRACGDKTAAMKKFMSRHDRAFWRCACRSYWCRCRHYHRDIAFIFYVGKHSDLSDYRARSTRIFAWRCCRNFAWSAQV